MTAHNQLQFQETNQVCQLKLNLFRVLRYETSRWILANNLGKEGYLARPNCVKGKVFSASLNKNEMQQPRHIEWLVQGSKQNFMSWGFSVLPFIILTSWYVF